MRNAKAPLALALAAGLTATFAPGAAAQDARGGDCDLTGTTPVTLQLQWVTQAQFAGFFAARDKCFYAERGLDVTLNEADPTGPRPHVVGSQDGGPSSPSRGCPRCSRLRGKGESTS